MLVIWGIFMLMGVVLFAERSGIHYEGSKSQSAYLSENQIVTEKEAVKELKKTCLVIMDSQQESSQLAWEQFERIFQDMKVGTDVADLKTDTLPNLDSYETVVVLIKYFHSFRKCSAVPACSGISAFFNCFICSAILA